MHNKKDYKLNNSFNLYKDQGFELILLEQLISKELNLMQVSQLLLLRQGAYDTIGVFYDAIKKNSAFQIMGLLTGDKKLCKLTNVLILLIMTGYVRYEDTK